MKLKFGDWVEYDNGVMKGTGEVVGLASIDTAGIGRSIILEDLSGNIPNKEYPYRCFVCFEIHIKKSINKMVKESEDHDTMADKLYSSLWQCHGYTPDQVVDAFREAIVKTAIDICGESGTEAESLKYYAETITNWMKLDIPKLKGKK